jgi:hypothetical protein
MADPISDDLTVGQSPGGLAGYGVRGTTAHAKLIQIRHSGALMRVYSGLYEESEALSPRPARVRELSVVTDVLESRSQPTHLTRHLIIQHHTLFVSPTAGIRLSY